MSLLDAFTGAPVAAASGASRDYLGNLQTNLIGATGIVKDQNAGLLTSGFNDARGALSTGYDTATGAINAGAGNAYDYLNAGTTGATDALASARGALTANGGAFQPLTDAAARYGKGAGLYADALGINGAEGNTRAATAFTSNPAYEYTLNQGIDAINRRANAGGMLVGGNPNRDAIAFATNAANQNYGSWLDRLKDYNGLEYNATAGAAAGNAGINSTLAGLGVTDAGLLSDAGKAKAAIATGQATSLADLARALYGGDAGLSTGLAASLSGNNTDALRNATSVGMGIAPQVTGSFQNEAAAAMKGDENLWNFALGLGTLGARVAGGNFGGAGGALGGTMTPSSAALPTDYAFRNGYASPTQRA